jgi:DNA-directed RNA polymerase subunit beta'
MKAVIEGGDIIVPLADQILGRTSARDVFHPVTDELIVKAGHLIDEAVDKIDEAGMNP